MGKLKKVYDKTFSKGPHQDDSIDTAMHVLNPISHKPTEHEYDLVCGDIGDMSYYTIFDKKFRIVVYIEE